MDHVHIGSDSRRERLAGLGGVVFGGILLVWLIRLQSTIPAQDAPEQEWLAFMTDDGGLWLAYAVLVGVGLTAFLWCLGSIRAILARAEGGAGRLSSVMFAAGVLTVGLLAATSALIGAFPIADEFLAAFDADAQVGLAFLGAAGIFFPYTAMAAGVTVAAGSAVMLRTNALPRWFAWASLVSGPVIFVAGVVAGAFLLLPLWAIVVGVLTMTGAGDRFEGSGDAST